MLEEVRESRAAGHFVTRPDVIPDIDGDNRNGSVFMDVDAETVRECDFVVGDETVVHQSAPTEQRGCGEQHTLAQHVMHELAALPVDWRARCGRAVWTNARASREQLEPHHV